MTAPRAFAPNQRRALRLAVVAMLGMVVATLGTFPAVASASARAGQAFGSAPSPASGMTLAQRPRACGRPCDARSARFRVLRAVGAPGRNSGTGADDVYQL